MKKLIHFLKVWDGVWSIPFAILVFVASGYGIVSMFGPEAGSMLPVYLQRLFYASLCLVVCNFVVLMGMYMNFRGIFRYYIKDSETGYNDLSPLMKIKILMVLYFSYFVFFTLFLIFV